MEAKFITLTKLKSWGEANAESDVTINTNNISFFEPAEKKTHVHLIGGRDRDFFVKEEYGQVYQAVTGKVFL